MKLTPESLKFLKTLLETVSIAKIDRLIIEDKQIRGIDDLQSVVLISKADVPDFGNARVGLVNVSTLINRINLFQANEDFSLEAIEIPSRADPSIIDISSFKINTKNAKFEFKLGRADLIKAPKKMNDEFVWAVIVPQELVKTLQQAANTIDSDSIALISKSNGEVFFEIVDSTTQDTFTIKIADTAEWLGEEDRPTQSFVNYYSAKSLLPLLKAVAAQTAPVLVVGEQGMLQITVNNHVFTLLPREE